MIKIILGSKSDLGELLPTIDEMSAYFDAKLDVTIASAHRSPDRVHQVVTEAEQQGTKVFIAAAGGAAHLAGAIAARTTKPVIGVPMETKLSGGLDSLLSTAQMPGGVPVATVGVGNYTNAIILAVQILAIGDENLAKQLRRYKDSLIARVERQDALAKEELNAL